jgi:hypothetical protein
MTSFIAEQNQKLRRKRLKIKIIIEKKPQLTSKNRIKNIKETL